MKKVILTFLFCMIGFGSFGQSYLDKFAQEKGFKNSHELSNVMFRCRNIATRDTIYAGAKCPSLTYECFSKVMDENLKIFYRNMQSYDWKKNRCQEWMIASGSSSRKEDLEDRIEELEDEVLSLKNRLSD